MKTSLVSPNISGDQKKKKKIHNLFSFFYYKKKNQNIFYGLKSTQKDLCPQTLLFLVVCTERESLVVFLCKPFFSARRQFAIF